jgi:hypothetical protein
VRTFRILGLATIPLGVVVANGCTGNLAGPPSSGGPPLPIAGGPISDFDAGITFPPSSPRPQFGPTVTASVPPPPISGGTLLVTHDGNTTMVADPDRDVVYVVDVKGTRVLFTVALQAGDEPGRLIEDAAGRVHVSLRTGGAVATIDPTTGTLISRQSVCPAPRGLAYDPSADAVWVACATGELVSLPAAGGPATQSFVVERDLRDVILQNGAIAVSSFRSAEVLRIAADGTITRRDTMEQVVPETSPHVAWRAIPGPSGRIIVVHQEESTRPIPTAVPGAYGVAGGMLGEPIVDSVVSILGPDGSTQFNQLLSQVVLPVDVALSPDGTSLAVVSAGSNFAPTLMNVTYLSYSTGVQIQLPPAGAAATAVAFDGAGDLLVQVREPASLHVLPPQSLIGLSSGDASIAFDDASSGDDASAETSTGDASAEDAGTDGASTGDASRADASTGPLPPGVAAVISLSSISRDDTGHDIFHAQAGSFMACASCHPEGGDDGHVWSFNAEPRRTPSLRGTISGTAPYHWPGDEPNLTVLVDDVYTQRMGGALLIPPLMTAMQSWVDTIPPPPAPSWIDAASAQRGQALFQRADVQCSTCHVGPKFTNNLTLDVGTGGMFQVPPLIGVGWRTPLLHNGCAATIADRFGACATPTHGSISTLSAQDISDLGMYLESL